MVFRKGRKPGLCPYFCGDKLWGSRAGRFVCAALFCLPFHHQPAAGQVKDVLSVPIIHGTGLSSSGVVLPHQAIRGLQNAAYQIQLYRVYLETIWFSDVAFQKAAGAFAAPPLRFLDASLDGPVVSLANVDHRHGEAGGYIASLAGEARLVGDLAVRIFKGAGPIMSDASLYMSGSLAAKRWDLEEKNPPSGSIPLNQQPGFWESYRRYAVAGGIILTAQTGAIVALLWQWKRRRKVQVALQKSEEKFSKTFRNAPMAVALTSVNNHRYIDVNETFEAITGWTRSEVIGRTPIELGVWANPQQKYDQVSRLLGGASLQNMEFSIRTKSGELRTVLTASELVEVNNERCVLSISSDITELKRAQDAIRESEERFRLVANTAPVMIWMTGTEKLCSYVNQTWLAFTGRCLSDELGNGWADGIFGEDLEECLKTFTAAFDRREPFEMEYRARRHDGEYRWIFDLGVPRFHADGSFAGYIGSCIDVTERKLAEEALSSVSRKLIEAHEEERTWIARELHDDVNQRLALLAVNLDVLNGELPSSAADARRHAAEIKQQIKELGIDVQALSHRLHSSKLEYLGLSAAAGAFCRELSERKGAQIDFSSDNVPRSLPEETSLCLFRVLQEALQNAVKHSGSERYRVSIICDSDEVTLTVSDSGCGFNTEEALRTPGLGLTSMRERTKIVHGDLLIDSRKNGGTVVRARVPIHTSVSAAAKAATA